MRRALAALALAACGPSTWPTPDARLELVVPSVAQRHAAGLHVRVEGAGPLVLYRQNDEGEWKEVCTAPCDDTSLEPGDYQLRTDWNLVVTNPFRIDGPAGTTGTLRVGPTPPPPTNPTLMGGTWL